MKIFFVFFSIFLFSCNLTKVKNEYPLIQYNNYNKNCKTLKSNLKAFLNNPTLETNKMDINQAAKCYLLENKPDSVMWLYDNKYINDDRLYNMAKRIKYNFSIDNNLKSSKVIDMENFSLKGVMNKNIFFIKENGKNNIERVSFSNIKIDSIFSNSTIKDIEWIVETKKSFFFSKKDKNKINLYQTDKGKNKRKDYIKKLNIPGTENIIINHPAVSWDEKYIVFQTYVNNEMGYELYYSKKSKTGWEDVQHLQITSTQGNEINPFFDKWNFLYFSTNEIDPYSNKYMPGGYDVYYFDFEKKFEFVKIFPHSFNTNQNELCFLTTHNDGENNGFFVRNNSIYRFKNLIDVTPEYHALLISGSNFDNNSCWENLPNTQSEMEKLGKVLKNRYGFSITVLNNPTKKEILDSMNYLKGKIGRNTNFLFAVSTHGSVVRDTGYIIPRDAGCDSIIRDNWLSYEKILRILDEYSSKHILIIADACHSGAIHDIPNRKFKGGDDPDSPYYLKNLERIPSFFVISRSNKQMLVNAEENIFMNEITHFLNTFPKFKSHTERYCMFGAEKLFNHVEAQIKQSKDICTLPLAGYFDGIKHKKGYGEFIFRLNSNCHNSK